MRHPTGQGGIAGVELSGFAQLQLCAGALPVQAQAHRQPAHLLALLTAVAPGRKVFDQARHIRRAAIDGHTQVFAEAAARFFEVPDLRDFEAKATRHAIGLQTALHNHQLVVLELVSVCIEHRFIGSGFDHSRLVIEFEQREFAALAVDHAQVGHDGSDQLRLSRINQVCNLAFGKLAHFELDFFKKMTRQEKSDGSFFVRQARLHAPGHGFDQRRLLRAGGVRVAHVKKAALVGIGLGGGRELKRPVHRSQQFGAVQVQVVKSAGLDESLHSALVELGLVHAHAKVIQRSKQSALFARGDHGRNGLLACALDGAQAVTDALVGDGLEAVVAAVHVRRLKADAHLDGVTEQDLELIGVVHLHRHVGAEKLRRVMHLEPGRVVGQ